MRFCCTFITIVPIHNDIFFLFRKRWFETSDHTVTKFAHNHICNKFIVPENVLYILESIFRYVISVIGSWMVLVFLHIWKRRNNTFGWLVYLLNALISNVYRTTGHHITKYSNRLSMGCWAFVRLPFLHSIARLAIHPSYTVLIVVDVSCEPWTMGNFVKDTSVRLVNSYIFIECTSLLYT